jgi:hypothetical protein
MRSNPPRQWQLAEDETIAAFNLAYYDSPYHFHAGGGLLDIDKPVFEDYSKFRTFWWQCKFAALCLQAEHLEVTRVSPTAL